MTASTRDQWAEWLLHRRHGDDPERLQGVLDFLSPVRDRVLANARVTDGETVLDVGCGDGLIAFGALEHVGEQGQVVFSDISQDLLDHSRQLAEQLGMLDRCRFVRASADDLAPIADASVDIVTTRSVLIYVSAKQQAFAEFFRVLRPGGRFSIFEPINRFSYGRPTYDAAPIQELAAKIDAVFRQVQPPERSPMLDFDERDLLAFAEAAGFHEIHLELRISIAPAKPQRWETFLHTSGNPAAPTLAEAIQRALTPAEAARYEAYRRPMVEQGQGTERGVMAYLWAIKR